MSSGMDQKEASKAEQADISSSDQVQQQLHGASAGQQSAQPAAGAAGTGMPQMPAAFWAPVSAGLDHSSGTLAGHGTLLGVLSLPGLVPPLEVEAGVAAGGAVDPLSTAGALPGMWSGSNSRGDTPSSTISSSGGRLRPQTERQESGAPVRADTPGSATLQGAHPRRQQQQQQQGDLAYGSLSLPASPTMLQYQQASAGAAMRAAALSNFSSPSSGSWPDVDLGSGSLLAGLHQGSSSLLAGVNTMQQGPGSNPMQGAAEGEGLGGQQQRAGQAGARSDSRASNGSGSGNESGGEGEAGVLVPSSAPLLQQEPGLPLGLQLHMPAVVHTHMQQRGADAHVQHRQQQQQQQQRNASDHQQQRQTEPPATIAAADHQEMAALLKRQQQHRDAQLMPPPPPPQHVARGQSPSAAAAAAAAVAAAAADAAARYAARPPPLVIPSTGAGSSSQHSAAAGQQLPHTQVPAQLPAQQQQQGGYMWFERPGSAPTPSPAYPPCSTTITPSMLAMGLSEAYPALSAGGAMGGIPAAAAAGGHAGTQSDSSSGGKGAPRRQRRPKSLPSSPAIAPAAAAAAAAAGAGSAAGEYSSSAGILASAAAAAGVYQSAAGAAGGNTAALSAVATAVLGSLGRVYIKVQCGAQYGWMDVRDSMIIVDVGTKKERKLTFAKFESLGGRGATRKWRTSIMALPEGPGDTVVPRTMPLGELLRKLNTDTKSIGQPGFCQDTAQLSTAQHGAQISSAHAGTSSSQGAAAAAPVGVTPSPEPRYSAAGASTPSAGLFSPGQRRPREESNDAADLGFRPTSVEPYSREGGVLGEEPDQGVESYGSTKRLRASQERTLPQSAGGMPASQHEMNQQQQQQQHLQQQQAAGGMSWLTSPPGSAGSAAAAAAGMGLSISAGGPLQQGYAWHQTPQGSGPAGVGLNPAAPGMLPPQPPLFQQQHAMPVFKQEQVYGQGGSSGYASQGEGFTQQQQQQHPGYGQGFATGYGGSGQQGSAQGFIHQGVGVYDQEVPAVMHLTPPDQTVAAMQPPLLPPSSSSTGGSQRQRRSAAAAGGGSSGGGMVTPPSSQSPAVAPGSAAAAAAAVGGSPMIITTGQGFGTAGTGRGRASSEDGRQQQQQQVSSSGRPIRQQSRRAVSAAAAAAARLDSYDKDGGPVSYAGGLRFLQVWCDQLPGNLDLQRMMVIPQAGEREGQAMSLSQFEILGGRGSARKWRRSVSVEDEGQMISLGDWLEKYAEAPGEGGLPCYNRYSGGTAKLRASSASPGVAGAVAAAAAAAAAGLPGVASWQAMQRYGQQQRDQGPARGALQGRWPQQQQQQQAAGMMQCEYDLLGQQVLPQQQQQQQQQGSEKQGSPVLEDVQDPASQAAALPGVHGAANLQQQQQAGGWGMMQGMVSHYQQQQQQMGPAGPYRPAVGSSYEPTTAAVAAAAAAAVLGVRSLTGGNRLPQQQQLAGVPPAVPGSSGGGGTGGGIGAAALPYVGGGDVLNNDFWHDIMNELAQDPVVDPHLHPAQVDVDMADNSRSPLTVHQQLLMLGSPPLEPTGAAAAAAGAAAIMGYTNPGNVCVAGTPGASLQQQHGATPGDSMIRPQQQQGRGV